MEEYINKSKLLKSIIVYTIYSYSYLFNYIPLIILNIFGLYSNTREYSLLISLLSNIILLLVLFKLYWKDLIDEFKIFIKDIYKNLDIGLIIWIIGLIIMVTSNVILVYVLKSKGATNELNVQTHLKQYPLIMGINICIIAPFIEEIIFRKTIKDFIKNDLLFTIFSFILFGSIHVLGYKITNPIDYLYIIPYGTLGACFSIMYNKTKTIYTSITFHAIHNTILFLFSIISILI